jgi:CHAD domain-containing protein
MVGPHVLKRPLERRVRALLRHLRPTMEGAVEPLHQCRVATRRLRELLPLCDAELSAPVAARARKRVRQLGGALGAVRELDVALGLVDELERAGRAKPAAASRLRQRVREERERQRERMRTRLKPAYLRKAARDVAEVLKAIGMRDATDAWALVLAGRLSERADRLRDAVAEAGPMYVSERVHEVRIAAKKLRYALELASETEEANTSEAVVRLKKIQDCLGRLHDIEILQELLHSIDVLAHRDEPWAGELGELDRDLAEECRRLHGVFVAGQAELTEVGKEARRVASRMSSDHGGHRGRTPALKMSLARAPESPAAVSSDRR